jgi:hypothetical protein
MLLIKFALGLIYFLPTPQSAAVSAQASKAATCLSPDVEWLNDLGYTPRMRFIPYHFAATGVPGSSMEGEPYWSVLFLSRSRHKSLLLFVTKLPDGSLKIVDSGYLIRKTSSGWETVQGNGGLGMYDRVARFVSEMERTPEYYLNRRTAHPKNCTSP